MNPWKNVEIEKDGKTHVGKYRVEGGIITVTFDAAGGGDKSARLGSSDAEHFAKRMLMDIVSELRP